MIGIINITQPAHERGPHTYALTINRNVIGHFVHNREDGLAVCLERAAECARQHKRDELFELYLALEKINEPNFEQGIKTSAGSHIKDKKTRRTVLRGSKKPHADRQRGFTRDRQRQDHCLQ